MIKIEKKYYFYAGHRNKQAGEKCGRLHGHTYDVKCIFEFKLFGRYFHKLYIIRSGRIRQ